MSEDTRAGADATRQSDGAMPANPDCFCMGLGPQLTALLRSLMHTEQVAENLRAAQLDLLKALRTVIDHRISTLSGSANAGRGTHLTVE